VSLQEEIDWLVYAACGLIPLDHSALGIGVFHIEGIWELTPGHRPFELALINAGPPAEWETARRELWAARFDAIKQNSHIASIEHSLFKRRWTEIEYEKEFLEACREWLREKAEFYLQHSAGGGPIAIDKWSAALWQDSRVKAVAFGLEGSKCNLKDFASLLKRAVDAQTVPADINKFKPAHKQIRGKLNVPRERFRVVGNNLDHYVWAGRRQ
jgi:hypothetical protein